MIPNSPGVPRAAFLPTRLPTRQAPLTAWLGMLLMALTLLCSPLANAEEYPEIDWVDLLPADDLEALENRPDFINNIAEGSAADLDGSAPADDLNLDQQAAWQRYDAALKSTRTRPEFDGRKVKIPGFVVPLEFDEQQNVSEFFLVPFFGACIHVPPPPPNQIIHVVLSAPYQMASIADPVWLTGTVRLQQTANDLGASAYSLDVKTIKPYYD